MKFKRSNADIEFYNPSYETPRPDGKSPLQSIENIRIRHDWTGKTISKQRFTNTHRELFEPLDTRYSKERALKLKAEETKGRKYDIITGASNEIKL